MISLTKGSFGGSAGDTWVDNRCKERNRRHDGIAVLREWYRLVDEWTEVSAIVLKVRVLDRQPQEVEDAFILSAASNVLRDAIPVILVHLESLEEQQGLLVGPLSSPGNGTFVLDLCITYDLILAALLC